MKSTAIDVRSYIEEQPEEWRDALTRLRAECRKQLRGYSEAMQHGMPSYRRAGQVEVGFAKQARYLSFYVLQQPVLDANRPRLEGLDVGKGCIRYRRPHQIDWAVVTDLLAETAASDAEVC
jgi:uncharacterized protein YdhG (YjbR/CyaY superfamily)